MNSPSTTIEPPLATAIFPKSSETELWTYEIIEPGTFKVIFSILLIFKFSPIVAIFLVNSSSTVLSLSIYFDLSKLFKSPSALAAAIFEQ